MSGNAAHLPPKKVSPILWILVGVFGFILLIFGVLVAGGFYAAYKAKQAGLDLELMHKDPARAFTKFINLTNPNLEVVTVDSDRQVMTVRDRTTGKTVVVNFDDIKRGSITFSGDGLNRVITGEAKIPSWVPDYPGSSPKGNVAKIESGSSGMIAFQTKDDVAKVLKFYDDKLRGAGYVMMTVTGQEGVLMASKESERKSVNVIVKPSDGETSVSVTWGIRESAPAEQQ